MALLAFSEGRSVDIVAIHEADENHPASIIVSVGHDHVRLHVTMKTASTTDIREAIERGDRLTLCLHAERK